MTHAIPEAARLLTTHLEHQSSHDAQLTQRLADAQDDLAGVRPEPGPSTDRQRLSTGGHDQTIEHGVTMGTTLIPPFRASRTHRDQAIAALDEANRIRLRRASLLRWIQGSSHAQSHERAAELILEPDQAVHSMLTLKLLQRVRGVGPAQAERLLTCADIAPTRTLDALTPRQRTGLAAVLRLRAAQLARPTRTKAS